MNLRPAHTAARHPAHRRHTLVWLGLACLGLASACSPAPAPQKPPEPAVHTDLTALARLIAWPETPRAAQWEVVQPAAGASSGLGPQDWALVAVLDLPPGGRQRLLAKATPTSGDSATLTAALVRPWFPPALRSRLQPLAQGGYSLGAPPLSAEAFFSSPLNQGFVLPWGEGEQVLLVLYTV